MGGFNVKIEVSILYRSERIPRLLGFFNIPNDGWVTENEFANIIPVDDYSGYAIKGMVNLTEPREEDYMLQIGAHGSSMKEVALHSVSAVNSSCTDESKCHAQGGGY